ncbi:SdpI family protein [Actinosynnema sp. NPDC020468]|uniref:SdpI family protein n=1 Tax=Actinosynnema sp. NPDC020468 TaxID=3154488 RepID=UPI0033C80AEA
MNIVLLVVLGLVGVAFVATGFLGVRGRLRPNRFFGVRTAATLRDEETFAVANRISGVPILVAGLVALASGVVVAVNPSTALVVGLVGLVGTLVIAAAGSVVAHRAAEALPAAEPAGCGGCACAGACGVLQRA